MAFPAKVLEVMIASPGGLDAERQVVRDVVSEWNAIHARDDQLVLLSRGWELDSGAELSGRPQGMINERILHHADIVVGLFWVRIGSPTGEAPSGTVEEIKRHHAAGKPVLLYFSQKDVRPGYDYEQYKGVQEFKAWAMKAGLVGEFHSETDLHRILAKDLNLALRNNPYLAELTAPNLVDIFEAGLRDDALPQLSVEAQEILRAAAADERAEVWATRSHSGLSVRGGKQNFLGEASTARDEARWLAAIRELRDQGLIEDINGKQEIFRVNNAGFQRVDGLSQPAAMIAKAKP